MFQFVELSIDMEKPFLDMAHDFKLAGETRYAEVLENDFDFPTYIEKLRDESRGENLSPGFVPMTTFWLIDDSNAICGLSRLRHYLTAELEKEGGHIGYVVPPSKRRLGYGTKILKLMLGKAKELGLDKVLVTCDSDNIASARIIQKNGGVLENEVISDGSGKQVSRYWIQL